MDLARAQRQDETFVNRPARSYEYTLTFGGQPRRAKGRIYFSPKEIKHLAIASLLVIGIGLSSIALDYSALSNWIAWIAFGLVLTASFLTHEVAHKVTAQRHGLWAEFRLTLWGAILTLVSVFSPFFKIIAPGAVMISGSARLEEIAKISIAGPIVNIVLSSVLLGIGFLFLPNPYAYLIFLLALWNGFIALFNLIPFGILDGFKIFNWSKMIWASAFIPSLMLTIIAYMLV